MSDLMHIPLAVRYNYESHAVAGALTALAVDGLLEGRTSKGKRLCIAVASALALGSAKEYLLDQHPHNREISPWGIGAAAALSVRFAF